jgi:DNA replication and repair protein RecF
MGINALLGNNSEGKTNVLEAISYLGLTKSFYSASDVTVLQSGKDFFEIEGRILTDAGTENTVHVSYRKDPSEKEISVNHARVDKLTSFIGKFPVVILSPESNGITFGPPAERRKFIDLILSQVNAVYFADLQEYRRVLRQRNKILSDARFTGKYHPKVIEPWDINLVQYGSRITQRRRIFAADFQSFVRRSYSELVKRNEEPQVEYVGVAGGSIDEITASMTSEICKYQSEEVRRGATLVGPHRDELKMSINGMSVQEYASHGQHKSLLVALKIAEFFYVKESRNEVPIFLLDDVFSELDESRSQHILDLIGGLGQTIITTTGESVFRGAFNWNGQNRKFHVERGTCSAT